MCVHVGRGLGTGLSPCAGGGHASPRHYRCPRVRPGGRALSERGARPGAQRRGSANAQRRNSPSQRAAEPARASGAAPSGPGASSHAGHGGAAASGSSRGRHPGSLNFRFDKFGFGVSRAFADWLFASAAVEIESHRDTHSHLIDPGTTNRMGCPPGIVCERFGAETPTVEATLDKFNLTVVAPLGNGLAISLARFDMPFGYERHDEILNLTATHSEVFQYGRPQRGTGFTLAYQFAPWLDAQAWVVNRWESETTHDPFDDNNKDKSFGGRIGFTPISRDGVLNFGIGAFWGPELTNNTSDARWVIDLDATWQPTRRLLFTGEFVYGAEQ